RASLHDKASLRIEQIRSEDQGWYECKVLMLDQQYDTFHNGSWVHLTVNAPPTFTETPPQYVEAKEGSSLTLTCMAFGNPKPTVTWMKEGDLLGANNKYQFGSRGSKAELVMYGHPPGAGRCSRFALLTQQRNRSWWQLALAWGVVSDGSLTVMSINRDDRGAYTCRAYSIQGEAMHTTRLLVQGNFPDRRVCGVIFLAEF
ncbi:UNVERIFIED_CONTAM: Protein turtle B, partial [Gekko kuhli]